MDNVIQEIAIRGTFEEMLFMKIENAHTSSEKNESQ